MPDTAPSPQLLDTPNRMINYVNRYRLQRDWSPLALPGLLLWLDAADSGTITESAGLVSQWSDKSGLGNNLAATGSQRPTTGTRTVGGANAIDFDGAGNFLYRDDALGLTGNPDLFVALVIESDSIGGLRPFFIGSTTASNAGKMIALACDGSYRFNNGSQQFSTPGTSPVAYSAQRASGDQYGDGLMFFDNVSQSETSASNPTNTPDIGNVKLKIGASTDTGGNDDDFFNGALCEVVVCNAVLTPAERVALQAWFTRWGI